MGSPRVYPRSVDAALAAPMSVYQHPAIAATGLHPAVLRRRARDVTLALIAAVLALVIALAVAVEVPHPSLLAMLGIVLGVLFVVVLIASPRYEVTLAVLALYLGLLDGPIKLETASPGASAIRDVLFAAISAGALARLAVSGRRVRLPPLSGWVLAFVALVLVETLNPQIHSLHQVIGGIRQWLEWVPFFFFGYLVMRSRQRFRKLFLILGVIALLNGVVSTIQTQLSPQQLAKWGPGYNALINGTNGLSGRTYVDGAGKEKSRPMALGSDEGFGGAVGVLALPGLIALLALKDTRRRWPVVLLCAGAVLAIATSLQRTAVLGGVTALVAFALLSFTAGRRVVRPLAAVLVAMTITVVVASVLSSTAGKGVFSRYDSISPSRAVSTSVNYREGTLADIPHDIADAPFGVGLATTGAATGFGGTGGAIIEGKHASAESQYNVVALELGLPGLLLWVALSATLIALAVRGLPRIEDLDTRLCLAAVFAVVVAYTVMGFAGPTTTSLSFGPFFWFALGIAAYWFVGAARDTGALSRGDGA
jgi:hypothetical protein